MQNTALDGVKVLDLTHHVAGPYCTKLLADFGADVLKVERPFSGDPARRLGPFVDDDPHPEKSLPFLYLNTNKRGITLDLKTDTGRGILRRLVEDSDLLVENFSPRVMPCLGLTYENLREVNPRLVMVSISNFGQWGPYRDFRANDLIVYALGGLSYIFGSNDREPLKHALHQAQFKAGTNAAVAAGIALFHQRMAGEGQHVDVSIQEAMASCLRDTTSLYTYMGAIRRRQPEHAGDVPRVPMKVRDGYVVPVAWGAVDWSTVADLLNAPELTEQRFSTPQARLDHADELSETLAGAFARRDRFELFREAHEHRGLLYGVVQDPKDVTENPQYRKRGYFAEVDHPVAGRATYPGAPFKMSVTPWRVQSPAPTLSQHNADVFCDRLGLSRKELMRMRASGVV